MLAPGEAGCAGTRRTRFAKDMAGARHQTCTERTLEVQATRFPWADIRATLGARRARSSAGQSSGLIIRWSLVRIQAGPRGSPRTRGFLVSGLGNARGGVTTESQHSSARERPF